MNKPQDFDSVKEYTQTTPLEPGGYICRIVKVQETTAQSSGAPMLKIGLEIAEGDRKGFYTAQFNADTRTDKKWPCIVNQLVYDSNGSNTTNRGFKTFTTCVEKSNSGFNIQWGDKFAECFKNKLIGGVFRREEYIGNDGKSHFSTKCAWFRSVDEIKAGVPIPEDKLLSNSNSVSGYPSPSVAIPYSEPIQNSGVPLPPDLSGFEEIASNVDLPF